MENTTPNTNNFLNWVEIKNFKSIKGLRLDPCKRVNVFIGKPNVGKSNILEGLALAGAGYSLGQISNAHSGSRGPVNFMKDFIRYDTFYNLFYDQDTSKDVELKSDKVFAIIRHLDERSEFIFLITHEELLIDSIGQKINSSQSYDNNSMMSSIVHEIQVQASNKDSAYNKPMALLLRQGGEFALNTNAYLPIKKYDFKGIVDFNSRYQQYLLPPDGKNLFVVVDQNKEIRKEVAKIFDQYNLDFVLSKSESRFELQKRDEGYVYKYPYSGIADTFQRFVFYLAAIESNKNSVIIFEEPEVHSFPPYTQDVAYKIIYSEENQFFVSTHSPYLLQTLVSNLKDDQLNVFVTYYENYETKVKALTPEELSFVQEYSTDVFFNLDRFVPNAQSANPA